MDNNYKLSLDDLDNLLDIQDDHKDITKLIETGSLKDNILLGFDHTNKPVLSAMDSHILIVGNMGSGKTCIASAIIYSFLCSNNDGIVKIIKSTGNRFPVFKDIFQVENFNIFEHFIIDLHTELLTRKSNNSITYPKIIFVIDGMSLFTQQLNQNQNLTNKLKEILRDGKNLGILGVITTFDVSEISPQIQSLIYQKLILKTNDARAFHLGVSLPVLNTAKSHWNQQTSFKDKFQFHFIFKNKIIHIPLMSHDYISQQLKRFLF